MKVALVSDTHFGARSDSGVFLEQHKKFFKEVFFPKLEEEGINTIIHAGDIFDKPRVVNMNTLNTVNSLLISELLTRKMVMHIIPGNHDSYFRDSLEVTTVNEIFYPVKNISAYHLPQTVDMGGRKIGFLPWGNIDFPKAEILIAHLDLVGFEMYKGVVNTEHGLDSLDFAKKYKLVLSGHYHHPSSKGNIHYIGAPIEMTWGDYGGPRGFQILDLDSLELEFVENPFRVFRKMTYDDTGKTLEKMLKGDFSAFSGICVKVHVKACADKYILSQFLKKIEENNPYSVTVIEGTQEDLIFEDIMDASKDTMSMIGEYVDNINLSVDKEALKAFMQSLYLEAERTSLISETR